jgi:hypothetical protein
MIEVGDEGATIKEVERLATKRLFKPDWTTAAAMPSWKWLRELDAELFGCPTCRADWVTLLQHAARHGQPGVVATLIKSGASVEYYGDRGCQALTSAVVGGDTKVIAMLVAHGADVNSTNFSSSVVHIAAGFSRKPEVLQYLLDAGAQPNVMDSRGWTALDWASVWNPGARPMLAAYGAVASTNRGQNR